jgi:hypothetical protein
VAYGLLGILVLILDIVAIIQTLGSSASQGEKIGWIIAILLFPFIGAIVWYFAGPRSGRASPLA